MSAIQRLFDETQYWPAEQLVNQQFEQLIEVARHAYATVPFYRDRLEGVRLTTAHELVQDWQAIPLLTRTDIQRAGCALHSTAVPQSHGAVTEHFTSGSTGTPVLVLGTELTDLFWHALTVRDHLWHQRDFKGKLAAIRYQPSGTAEPPHGLVARDWGKSTRGFVRTGPAAVLTINSSVEEQADWLKRQNSTYLLSYASAIKALANCPSLQAGALSNLREVRTFGEVVEPDCRIACRRAWNVPVTDVYSAQEVGYIALQCPDCEHYHVQSESVLVEVLDADGRPCLPGQVGQVVVSTLHNFAMPLLRYAIGDYTEVGVECGCGRTLPVLKRILGRQRNMLLLPDGSRRWPSFGQAKSGTSLPRFQQLQLVQHARHHIEANIVRPVPFTATEEKQFCDYVRETFGCPFDVTVRYLTEIPRTPGGKYEDFRSEVQETVP